MSFLGLGGYHVFVTGAAGGFGDQAVKEFLSEFSFQTVMLSYIFYYI
jgi:NAD(P)-dependent dehydrogenase (short-subunit alcohol dehydrogenase family)